MVYDVKFDLYVCVFYSDTPTLLRNATIHLWELVFCLFFFSSGDFKHWVNICQVIKKFILDNRINEVFTEPEKRTSLFQPTPGASLDQQIIWLAACKQEPSSNPVAPRGWTLWKTHSAASLFLSSWKIKQKNNIIWQPQCRPELTSRVLAQLQECRRGLSQDTHQRPVASHPSTPLNTPTPTPFSLGLRVCGNTNQVIMASSLILVGTLKQFSAGEN